MPSSTRVGAYVTTPSRTPGGLGAAGSVSSNRWPPRVITTRRTPSKDAPPRASSSSGISDSSSARKTSGRRRFAPERSSRARWSSSANGTPSYTRMTSNTPSPRRRPSSVAGIVNSADGGMRPSIEPSSAVAVAGSDAMAPMLCERALADPARNGGHDGLRRVGVVDPPQREACQAAREELRCGLDLLGRNPRAAAFGDEPGEDLAGSQVDPAPALADLVVAGAVPEQHHPRVAVLADVVEPVVQDRGQVRPGLEEGREVVLVLGEQGHVEGLLRLEVAVEHGRRHMGRGGHVVHARARGAVPGEEPAGFAEDQRAALGRGDSLLRRRLAPLPRLRCRSLRCHCYHRVTYVLAYRSGTVRLTIQS